MKYLYNVVALVIVLLPLSLAYVYPVYVVERREDARVVEPYETEYVPEPSNVPDDDPILSSTVTETVLTYAACFLLTGLITPDDVKFSLSAQNDTMFALAGGDRVIDPVDVVFE